MTFRVAAKSELNARFSIFQLNDIALGMEVNQTGSSPLLPLSPLAVRADVFIAAISRCAIYADVKLQKGFTGRIGKVLHRAGCWNLDPATPCRWPHRESLERYIESNVYLAAECNNVFRGFRQWLYESNPVGDTVRRFRRDQDQV